MRVFIAPCPGGTCRRPPHARILRHASVRCAEHACNIVYIRIPWTAYRPPDHHALPSLGWGCGSLRQIRYALYEEAQR